MNSASSVWSAGPARGGLWNSQEQRYAGCMRMKLDGGSVQSCLTGLAGKTILTANLKLHTETCWAGSVTHDLYYLKQNGLPASGAAPADFLTDAGIDVTLTQGEDTIINLQAWLQAMVYANTNFYGFGLGLPGSYVKMAAICELTITYQD